jgi:hypothetical protein
VKKKNRNLLISSRKLVQNGGYHVFSLAYQWMKFNSLNVPLYFFCI